MKENYEKLKANRPGEIKNGLLLSICHYGGRVFASITAFAGFCVLRNNGLGKRIMEFIEEPPDQYQAVGIEFFLEAGIYLLVMYLTKTLIKRNNYILELEKLAETEIKKKEEKEFPYNAY